MFANFAQFAAVNAPTIAQIEAACDAFGIEETAEVALPVLEKRHEVALAKGQTGKAKRTKAAIDQLKAGQPVNAKAAYEAQKTPKPKASTPKPTASKAKAKVAKQSAEPTDDRAAILGQAREHYAKLLQKAKPSEGDKSLMVAYIAAGILA